MGFVFGAVIAFFFILFWYAEKFNRMEAEKHKKKERSGFFVNHGLSVP